MNNKKILKIAGGIALTALGLVTKNKRLSLVALGGLLTYSGLKDGAEEQKPEEYYVEDSVIVPAPVNEVYAYLRNMVRFPEIFSHIESIAMQDTDSTWKMRAPIGMAETWNAEMVYDEPQQRFAWRSKAGEPLQTAGSMSFEDLGDNQTRVTTVFSYRPNPTQHSMMTHVNIETLKDDLARLKRQFV